MRIWLLSPWYLGIWAESRDGKLELQVRAGAEFRVFMGLGCEICKGTEQDTGFQFLRDLINWPAQKPQAGRNQGRNEPLVGIAVLGSSNE